MSGGVYPFLDEYKNWRISYDSIGQVFTTNSGGVRVRNISEPAEESSGKKELPTVIGNRDR